jgi:hypothetical protein
MLSSHSKTGKSWPTVDISVTNIGTVYVTNPERLSTLNLPNVSQVEEARLLALIEPSCDSSIGFETKIVDAPTPCDVCKLYAEVVTPHAPALGAIVIAASLFGKREDAVRLILCRMQGREQRTALH